MSIILDIKNRIAIKYGYSGWDMVPDSKKVMLYEDVLQEQERQSTEMETMLKQQLLDCIETMGNGFPMVTMEVKKLYVLLEMRIKHLLKTETE